MDTATFAAERREILTRSDDDLRPLVEDAFDNRVEGVPDWADDLVLAASVLWMEIYEAEAGRMPTAEEMEDYQQRLLASLEAGAPLENQFDLNRINLTTTWVSTFTVNDATTTAAAPGAELQWVTMHDPAVRASHVAADGQRINPGGRFTVDGYELAFPGDPVGPPDVWINCRCVVARVREDSEMTAQLTTDVALAAAAPAPPEEEEIVEEEIDDDVPGWDDDEIDVEVPWHGVIAPTGVKSGDRRRFTAGAMRFRDLPLPLRFQKVDAGGHDGSVVVANIERAWEEDGLIKAEGRFTLSPEADEAIGLIADGMLRGVSVDLDDVTVELQNEDGTAFDLDSDPSGAIENVVDGRVASAALVSIPAFQEAFVSLGPWEDEGVTAVTASGDCAPCAAREMDAYYEEIHAFAISEGEWDGSASRFSNTEWIRSTVVDRGPGYDTPKQRYAVPIREPNGDLSRAAVHNAAARIDQVDAPAAAIAAGKRKLVAAYRQLDEDPPESLTASAFADLTAEDQVDEAFAPGTRDGPGWITNPKETQRLRTYWTRGKGAAKIRWGQPGDFNRCRRQLAKYVPNPHYLAGTCANLHKVAMGIWPGQHRGKHAADTLVAAAPAFRVAGIEPEHVPPRGWFADPALTGPTPLTIDEDGRVFGHLALWDTCHVGLGLSVGDGPDCVTPPTSPSGYASFMNKSILTDDGLVAVGTITMETGHAPGRLGAFPAAAHYDNTGTAAADVVAGEDDYGIWISGAVRPGTDVQALRGATLSGDWRTIGDHYELVAALAVNVPGFPIPRLAVAASGVSQALVAAGVVQPHEEHVAVYADTAAIAKGIYTALTEISDRAQARDKLAAQVRAARRAELVATCAK